MLLALEFKTARGQIEATKHLNIGSAVKFDLELILDQIFDEKSKCSTLHYKH